MADDEALRNADVPEYTQLIQVRVPLDEAADAFATRDADGRIPILVVPRQLNRVRNEFVLTAAVILALGFVGERFVDNQPLATLAVPAAALFFVLGVYRSVVVRIPEGASALLMRGGRYIRTIGPGPHLVAPWVLISYLVTRREIPFDVPMVQTPTKDNVRANVDTLITFRIADPYQFVYNISAGDFDQVFQAMCQDSLRLVVRKYEATQVIDLTRTDLTDVVAALSADVKPYGVEITKINVTYAQPPGDFMQSLETRQLSVIQQAEQMQRQALAKRRQADEEALAHQKAIAEVDRERDALKARLEQEEARRRIVELEAETEELRLRKLQERLRKYPEAVRFVVETRQLDIAQALAGNSRAVLQIGGANDIVRSLLMHDTIREGATALGDDASSTARDEPGPTARPASQGHSAGKGA